MKAFSYQRFSSEKQKQGDSITRQSEAVKEWLKRNPTYILDESITFKDEARSAFKGEHLSEGGKLGLFLRMVDDGKIPKDSALIVESFDRLSRLPITEANELFSGIIRRGITVVFTNPERVLNKELIDSNPFSLIELLIVGIRSNEESQTKSRRVKAAVERRKEQTKGGKKLKSLCPPWLECQRGEYRPIEERVNVVSRIFELYLQGFGCYVIARKLNAERVPTFGRGNTKSTKGLSAHWYVQIIKRLLSDKRLMGHCSFNDCSDYYPKVINEELFYRAQSRQRRPTLPGRKNKAPLNLFRGLTRCGICGGAVTRADKERFGYLHQYFCCENGRTGKGCRYITFKNQWLECTFFELIDSNSFYASQVDRVEAKEQDNILGQLAAAEKQKAKYFKLIEDDDNPSKLLVERLKQAEFLVESLQAKVDVAKGMDLDRLEESNEFFELKNNLGEWLQNDARRVKIADYIRSSVDRIVIRFNESVFPAYTVYFKSGNIFTVTIIPHGERGRCEDWEFQTREGQEIGFKEDEMIYSMDSSVSLESEEPET